MNNKHILIRYRNNQIAKNCKIMYMSWILLYFVGEHGVSFHKLACNVSEVSYLPHNKK